MMMYIDHPSRCRKDRIDRRAEIRAASYKDSHQRVQRGASVMTPQGHPARSNPGQIVGPDEAVVLMRRTRAYFIKAPDTCVVHREAGYINAALHCGSLRDPRRCSEG